MNLHHIRDILTGAFPSIARILRYRNPRRYWSKRGGDIYFQEQESLEERHQRAQFIAERLGNIDYQSVLEIGCGYGKQLQNLKMHSPCLVVGIDWSRAQLIKAKEICHTIKPFLLEADAARLPFKDRTFDLVLTSAVIMHNPEAQAKHIVSEILRVGRKFIAHNEDTDITFTRHGYDMAKTYEAMGIKILESGNIPLNPPLAKTQFSLMELRPSDCLPRQAQDIPLLRHAQSQNPR